MVTKRIIADAQLDEWIAINVMGWYLDGKNNGRIGDDYWIDVSDDVMPYKNWCPTTDFNQAWMVEEKLKNDNEIVFHDCFIQLVSTTKIREYATHATARQRMEAVYSVMEEK